jgi:glucose 1-dehydrogenase
MDLSGKVAVVTGSATGVGQGIALRLAADGAKVAVTHNQAPADKTMAMIKDAGGTALDIKCNVSSQNDVENLMETVNKTFGGIDILVNNAAIQPNKWLLEYTEEEYGRVVDVNLMGYIRCIRAAAPFLKKSAFGRVINISSIHGKRPTSFDVVYAMTKAAIIMLTREAAIELAEYGITVNAVCPGGIKISSKSGNPVFKPVKPASFRQMPYGRTLSGRIGEPSDIGYIVSFLAADESQNITGSSLRTDSGNMMVSN